MIDSAAFPPFLVITGKAIREEDADLLINVHRRAHSSASMPLWFLSQDNGAPQARRSRGGIRLPAHGPWGFQSSASPSTLAGTSSSV